MYINAYSTIFLYMNIKPSISALLSFLSLCRSRMVLRAAGRQILLALMLQLYLGLGKFSLSHLHSCFP